jgi:hypothetical protein
MASFEFVTARSDRASKDAGLSAGYGDVAFQTRRIRGLLWIALRAPRNEGGGFVPFET